MSAYTLDYGRTIHVVRNIIGKITYGVVGLDKIQQKRPEEAEAYIESFLSLFESDQASAGRDYKLLPEITEAIAVTTPKIREELQRTADLVRRLSEKRAGPNEKDIALAYGQLTSILDELYGVEKARSRSLISTE